MIGHGLDLSLAGNVRRLEVVAELDKPAAETGVPLAHLAVAFARAHPAVSSVITGPRTHEQLTDLLTGAEVELDEDVPDRIDELVPPGTDLNPSDVDYAPPSLTDKTLPRR